MGELTFLQEVHDTASHSVYTYTGQNLGAADSKRYIIAAIVARKAGAANTLNSVTIGGVAASIAVQFSRYDGNSNICALAVALVPTGTTGDVVTTFGDVYLRSSTALYRATDLESVTPVHTATANANPAQMTINVAAGGFVIANSLIEQVSYATWSGAAEAYDVNFHSYATHSGASALTTATQANTSVSCTWNPGLPAPAVAASWRFTPAHRIITII